jgi:hypothetical protein
MKRRYLGLLSVDRLQARKKAGGAGIQVHHWRWSDIDSDI